MDREKAIKILKELVQYRDDDFTTTCVITDEQHDALDMAIESLRNGETEVGSTESATTTHGRLIDADALIEYAEKEEEQGVTFCIDSAEELGWLLEDNAPTIQTARAVGEWERISFPDGDVMECTNCGYRDWGDVWKEESRNFCPHCGAFMHEEELCSREEYAMQIL